MLTPQEQPRDLKGEFASVHGIKYNSNTIEYRKEYRALYKKAIANDAQRLEIIRQQNRESSRKYREKERRSCICLGDGLLGMHCEATVHRSWPRESKKDKAISKRSFIV